MSNITAAIMITGNEILSGRTQDKNVNYIAKELSSMGIELLEVRIIADIKEMIVDTVNELRKKYTYVFSTGGIGPTHDDITAECIAEAFGVKNVLNNDAFMILEKYYGKENLTEGRLRMAHIPETAGLIENSASGAPGFYIENVYVLAGVPYIMQAMFNSLKPTLTRGEEFISKTLEVKLPESYIANVFADLQKEYPDIKMGSYPFQDGKIWGTHLVLRGTNIVEIEKAYNKLELEVKKIEERK